MKFDKRYVMIVTAEDDRYGTSGHWLDYWLNNPWDGELVDIIQADNVAELDFEINEQGYEGMFYFLYDMGIGRMISYGCIDGSYIDEMEETVDATYTSVWENGVSVRAKCKVNMKTGEVFIECDRVDVDEILEDEYITISGVDYNVSNDPKATTYWYK